MKDDPVARIPATSRQQRAIAHLPSALMPVCAILLAFAFGAVLIALGGVSPLRAYAALLQGAFGSKNNIAETLVKTTPLLLAGMGTAIAYRARVINIGGDGQIYMGAVGAAFVGLFLGDLPPVVGIPMALLAGFLLGAVWGGIAAVAKVKFRANELITTLMMNYIAFQIVSFLISGPWKDPNSTEPFTALVATGIRLPILLPGTRLHAGIVVALLATLCLWFVLRNTVFGYRLAVVGANEKAAEYSGIDTSKTIILSMLLSGGLAGLAGVAELAGLHYRLLEGLSPNYGYTAVAIAMLGKGQPLGVLVASFLFAALMVGGDGMQQISRVPVPVIMIIEGLVLLFVLGGETLSSRRRVAEQIQEGK